MSAKNRADLITKLHKFTKKEFTIVTPPSNRLVIEQMLYGCCLENSTFEAADEAFARLQENFYDWNEVRVTTASELAELMKNLANPNQAAVSIKKTLHGIFETYYQFDLEFLRKENLSKAVSQFEKFKGVSPFVVSHVAQHGLGGHSIPLDRSMMLLCYTLGIVTEEEASQGRVPGLERTIPKVKGIEFFSLTHQLAVAFSSSPFNTKIREQLLKLSPDAKERFPKRGASKKAAEAKIAAALAAERKVLADAAAAAADAAAAKTKPKSVAKKKVTKQPVAKKKAAKPPATSSKAAVKKKVVAKKKTAARKTKAAPKRKK